MTTTVHAHWRISSRMHGKLAVLTVATLTAPIPTAAQNFLEQFSYEGLGLAGVGLEVGRVASDRVTSEWTVGVRVDYGMIAPRVRVMFGANYFKGELDADEISRFEASLGRVVQDPTGDAVIDVGRITWTNVEVNLDLQYLIPLGQRFTSYAGLGLGVHLRNGAGAAIDNTFVEDALDTVAAGANVSLGAELALTDQFHFTTDLRGGLSSELLLTSVRAGFLYRIPPSGA